MAGCPFRDLFGKPGEGAHRTRIFGLALVDLLATVGLSALICRVLKVNFLSQEGLLVFMILMLLSLLLHKLFCVETTLTKAVFG